MSDDTVVLGQRLVPLNLSERTAVLEYAIQVVKDRTDARFAANNDAVDHQFTETMRRLDELNNHHAMTRQTLAETVSRDKFDTFVHTDIEPLKAAANNFAGRMAMISAAGGLLGSAITLAIQYLKTK